MNTALKKNRSWCVLWGSLLAWRWCDTLEGLDDLLLVESRSRTADCWYCISEFHKCSMALYHGLWLPLVSVSAAISYCFSTPRSDMSLRDTCQPVNFKILQNLADMTNWGGGLHAFIFKLCPKDTFCGIQAHFINNDLGLDTARKTKQTWHSRDWKAAYYSLTPETFQRLCCCQFCMHHKLVWINSLEQASLWYMASCAAMKGWHRYHHNFFSCMHSFATLHCRHVLTRSEIFFTNRICFLQNLAQHS